MTTTEKPKLLLEQARRNGEWSWFCEEDGCGWSGHGWMSQDGARREGERHECRAG